MKVKGTIIIVHEIRDGDALATVHGELRVEQAVAARLGGISNFAAVNFLVCTEVLNRLGVKVGSRVGVVMEFGEEE